MSSSVLTTVRSINNRRCQLCLYHMAATEENMSCHTRTVNYGLSQTVRLVAKAGQICIREARGSQIIGRSASTNPNMEVKPIETSIRQKLSEAFQPSALEVINESGMHNVPKGSETHFKVVVVSDRFDGQPLIKRHRMVNEVLQTELQTGVHALSILAKTPSQWTESGGVIGKSPPCQGGAGL